MSTERSLDFPISDSGSVRAPGSTEEHLTGLPRSSWREEIAKTSEQLFSYLIPCGVVRAIACRVRNTLESNRENADMALQYYNTLKGTAFQLVEPVHSEDVDLYPPGSDHVIESWCHVIFVATEPGNNGTEKYFFAEIQKSTPDALYIVRSCSVLEEGDWGGVSHGCVVCSPGLLLHPRPGKFVSGSSGYRVVEVNWV